MPWIQAAVSVSRADVALAETLLESQGALAVSFTDHSGEAILEPGVGETPLWERVEVRGLFPAGVDARKLQDVLSLAPGVTHPGQVAVTELGDRDWERAGTADLVPMQFGSGLWVVPRNHERPPGGGACLLLDPGLAFGTGAHPTTRLSLEWIDAQQWRGRRVLDFGCGSGVLGIACALKGAARVECVDNDPQALRATAWNSAHNGVSDRVAVIAADDYTGRAVADAVLANILAGTLSRLAGQLAGAARRGGHIVLCGILEDQAAAVRTAYEAVGVSIISATRLDGWVRICGVKQ